MPNPQPAELLPCEDCGHPKSDHTWDSGVCCFEDLVTGRCIACNFYTAPGTKAAMEAAADRFWDESQAVQPAAVEGDAIEMWYSGLPKHCGRSYCRQCDKCGEELSLKRPEYWKRRHFFGQCVEPELAPAPTIEGIALPVRYDGRGQIMDSGDRVVVYIYAWNRNVKEKNDTIGQQIVRALNAHDELVSQIATVVGQNEHLTKSLVDKAIAMPPDNRETCPDCPHLPHGHVCFDGMSVKCPCEKISSNRAGAGAEFISFQGRETPGASGGNCIECGHPISEELIGQCRFCESANVSCETAATRVDVRKLRQGTNA